MYIAEARGRRYRGRGMMFCRHKRYSMSAPEWEVAEGQEGGGGERLTHSDSGGRVVGSAFLAIELDTCQWISCGVAAARASARDGSQARWKQEAARRRGFPYQHGGVNSAGSIARVNQLATDG